MTDHATTMTVKPAFDKQAPCGANLHFMEQLLEISWKPVDPRLAGTIFRPARFPYHPT
jgi:hypothetical protein